MTNEQKIWDYLKTKGGFNDFAIAGIMSNIGSESGFKPNNLQNSYEKKLGYSDEEYTEAVSVGAYSRDRFIYDKGGYGLCQWTHWSRKAALYDFFIGRKPNNPALKIDDLYLQLDFMCLEIKPSLRKTLEEATNAGDAAVVFMLEYEKPANQSVENQQKRANYALELYNTYAINNTSGYYEGYTKGYSEGYTNAYKTIINVLQETLSKVQNN